MLDVTEDFDELFEEIELMELFDELILDLTELVELADEVAPTMP